MSLMELGDIDHAFVTKMHKILNNAPRLYGDFLFRSGTADVMPQRWLQILKPLQKCRFSIKAKNRERNSVEVEIAWRQGDKTEFL